MSTEIDKDIARQIGSLIDELPGLKESVGHLDHDKQMLVLKLLNDVRGIITGASKKASTSDETIVLSENGFGRSRSRETGLELRQNAEKLVKELYYKYQHDRKEDGAHAPLNSDNFGQGEVRQSVISLLAQYGWKPREIIDGGESRGWIIEKIAR